MLERDGVIYSVPGKGSFLAKPEAVLEKRRAGALDQLRQAVREALDCGVAPEELAQALDQMVQGKKEESP